MWKCFEEVRGRFVELLKGKCFGTGEMRMGKLK